MVIGSRFLAVKSDIPAYRQVGQHLFTAVTNMASTVPVTDSQSGFRAFSREEAAYPLKSLRLQKYWSPVGRVDNAYGDRNLFCSCVPLSAYED